MKLIFSALLAIPVALLPLLSMADNTSSIAVDEFGRVIMECDSRHCVFYDYETYRVMIPMVAHG